VVTDTYQIGPYRLGVRWSEPDFAGILRSALPTRLVRGPSPANFSVVVGRSPGRARPKHQLYSSTGTILETISPGRILVALVRALDDVERFSTPNPLLRLRADVLVSPSDRGSAVLVDHRLRWFLNHEAGRIRRAGWRALDVATAEIDHAGEIVVRAPALPLHRTLGDLAAEGPNDPMLLVDPPPRLRLGALIVGAAADAMDRVAINGVRMIATPPGGGIDRASAAQLLGWLFDALNQVA
jgi:hypothetical protein